MPQGVARRRLYGPFDVGCAGRAAHDDRERTTLDGERGERKGARAFVVRDRRIEGAYGDLHITGAHTELDEADNLGA